LAKRSIRSKVPPPEDWSEVLASFEHHLYSKGRAEGTVVNYSSPLKSFARFYRDELGKRGPFASRLVETDLIAYIDYLRRDKLQAPSTINRSVAALRALAQFLLEKRWHRRDLARDLKTMHVPPPGDPPRLSAREVRKILAAVNLSGRNGLRDLATLQLLLQCGLRVGEVARLKIEDVSLHRTRGRIRVRDEKTRSERVVPLNASVRSALSRYLEDVRGVVADSEALFLSERRRAISVKTVQYLVKKYLSAIGRPDLSAHDIRHHFALNFYQKVRNLTAVQQVLGHRSLLTTARYLRSSEQEIRKAMEALPGNLHGSPSQEDLSDEA